MSRSSWCEDRPVCIASYVSTLNRSVPIHCTAALHQVASAPNRAPRRSVACRSSIEAANVKRIEPTKKITASAPAPTSSTTPGNGPMTKHTEPSANPAAIARSQPASASGPRARRIACPTTERPYGAPTSPGIPPNG